jgi:D-aminopeptidase
VSRQRARQTGIWFGELSPGQKNMITDVAGVRVGHCTIIKGSGPLQVGKGPVRTGVTAILPHGRNLFREPVKAAFFDMNGCGGLHGSLQIREFGIIDTPIMLTNTMSMGAVSDATVRYMLKSNLKAGVDEDTIIPIVSECDDSFLNDSRGLHVREEHVFAAIEDAKDSVAEGAVGAGTGMSCYDFKGGIGTASRKVTIGGEQYTIGALVLSNHGDRKELRIDGVPVGFNITPPESKRVEQGSIVTVVATDAPVDARQLGRLARRTFLGLAATGFRSHNSSGDISVAFSTANMHERADHERLLTDQLLQDKDLTPLFCATADCAEESVVNSLFMAETIEGRDGNTSFALPIDKTLELMKSHGRLLR